MIETCDIGFGVEVEGLLLNERGEVSRLTLEETQNNPYHDPEVDLLFSSFTPEVEVCNLGVHNDVNIALNEITILVGKAKEGAAHKSRTLTYDSHTQEHSPLNTIGTHIHLDLRPFEFFRNYDPAFITLIGSEFMRYWFQLMVQRYCYSDRIKSRTKHLIESIDFSFDGHHDDIVEQELIRFQPKIQSVKLIKDRSTKGSLEICLPDSFDFTTEPDTFLDIVRDARNALRECLCSYERDEISPMSDTELKDILGAIL